MKRTTLFVPEELERELQLYARREGRPVASLVREAMAEYLARRSGGRALPSFAGQFESGHSDTSEHHDEILFKALDPHGTVGAPRRPRTAPRRTRAARRR